LKNSRHAGTFSAKSRRSNTAQAGGCIGLEIRMVTSAAGDFTEIARLKPIHPAATVCRVHISRIFYSEIGLNRNPNRNLNPPISSSVENEVHEDLCGIRKHCQAKYFKGRGRR
jgi:hypothetical protein